MPRRRHVQRSTRNGRRPARINCPAVTDRFSDGRDDKHLIGLSMRPPPPSLSLHPAYVVYGLNSTRSLPGVQASTDGPAPEPVDSLPVSERTHTFAAYHVRALGEQGVEVVERC